MCQNKTVPVRLHQNGRPAIDYFEPGELVYRRYKRDPLVVRQAASQNEHLSADAICLKDDSYNRESLCEHATDVLYSEDEVNDTHFFGDYGIIAFPHEALPGIYGFEPEQKDARKFRARLFHSPNDCMYPHCHQEVDVDGIKQVKLPKSIGQLIREAMLDFYQLIKAPR